jgi:hypothetical protein
VQIKPHGGAKDYLLDHPRTGIGIDPDLHILSISSLLIYSFPALCLSQKPFLDAVIDETLQDGVLYPGFIAFSLTF